MRGETYAKNAIRHAAVAATCTKTTKPSERMSKRNGRDKQVEIKKSVSFNSRAEEMNEQNHNWKCSKYAAKPRDTAYYNSFFFNGVEERIKGESKSI